ncbi:maltokinase [Acrasis kona]|uniref:Maltokinase n=1 Tax=Acrasis kona TaxID=1008807 RepID=A0AAW2ZQX1_9EUKA
MEATCTIPNLSDSITTQSSRFYDLVIEKILKSDSYSLDQIEMLITKCTKQEWYELTTKLESFHLPIQSRISLVQFILDQFDRDDENDSEMILKITHQLFQLRIANLLLSNDDDNTQFIWHSYLEKEIDITRALEQVILNTGSFQHAQSYLRLLITEHERLFKSNVPFESNVNLNELVLNMIHELLEMMKNVTSESNGDLDDEDEIMNYPPAQSDHVPKYLRILLESTRDELELHDDVLQELKKFTLNDSVDVGSKIIILKLLKQVEPDSVISNDQDDDDHHHVDSPHVDSSDDLMNVYRTRQILNSFKLPSHFDLNLNPNVNPNEWGDQFKQLIIENQNEKWSQELSNILLLWTHSACYLNCLFELIKQVDGDDLISIFKNHQSFLNVDFENDIFKLLNDRADRPLLDCRVALRSNHSSVHQLAIDKLKNLQIISSGSDFDDLWELCVGLDLQVMLISKSICLQERLLLDVKMRNHKLQALMVSKCCCGDLVTLLFAMRFIGGVFGVTANGLGHWVNYRFLLRNYLEQCWCFYKNDQDVKMACEAAIVKTEELM